MATLDESVISASLALMTADTGTGGLSNSTGNQWVRGGFYRVRDPHEGPDRTTNRPFVMVDIDDTPIDTSGEQNSRVRMSFHIYTKRDESFAAAEAVADRIETLFRGTSMTATGGWSFSKAGLFQRREGQATTSGLHDILECTVLASTGGVLSAGNQASFTWTSSGGMTITSTFQSAWTGRFQLQTREATPWGWKAVRRVTCLQDADGSLAVLASVDDDAMPVPDGVVGLLRLTEASGRYYEFYALLHEMRRGVDVSQNGEELIQYQWALSAQNNQLAVTRTTD